MNVSLPSPNHLVRMVKNNDLKAPVRLRGDVVEQREDLPDRDYVLILPSRIKFFAGLYSSATRRKVGPTLDQRFARGQRAGI